MFLRAIIVMMTLFSFIFVGCGKGPRKSVNFKKAAPESAKPTPQAKANQGEPEVKTQGDQEGGDNPLRAAKENTGAAQVDIKFVQPAQMEVNTNDDKSGQAVNKTAVVTGSNDGEPPTDILKSQGIKTSTEDPLKQTPGPKVVKEGKGDGQTVTPTVAPTNLPTGEGETDFCALSEEETMEAAYPGAIDESYPGYVLLEQLKAEEDGKQNVVVSNVNMNMILSMAVEGASCKTKNHLLTNVFYAKNVGASQGYLASTAKFYTDLANSYTQVALNNSIWNNSNSAKALKFKSDFINGVSENFGVNYTSANELDFVLESSSEAINKSVKQALNNKIGDVISSDLLSKSSALLISAAAIDMNWEAVPKVKSISFAVNKESEKVSVDGLEFSQAYYANTNYGEFVAFPLTMSGFYLVAMLPEGEEQGLPLDSNMADILKTVIDNMKRNDNKLRRVQIPQFQFETQFQIKKSSTLSDRLNLGPLFEDSADFSNMSETQTSLDVILGGTKVIVNDRGVLSVGSVAAAFSPRSIGDPLTPGFIIDRPFYFFIVKESKTAVKSLFSGYVANPKIAADPNK